MSSAPVTLRLEDAGAIAVVTLDRAERSNALDARAWDAVGARAREAGRSGARVVVLRAAGRHFCAGIDVEDARALAEGEGTLDDVDACAGRTREGLMRRIRAMQDAFSLFERAVEAPTVACVKGACVGAGVDLVTACDVRLAQRDATFCVKEVDLGIAADVGTLQRLPSVVGHGRAMELALTARTITADEALRIGLVSEVCDDVDARGMELARALAKKSPIALRGTKRVLLRARDDPNVERGLDYVAAHNAAMLMNADLDEALRARAERRPPVFSKL